MASVLLSNSFLPLMTPKGPQCEAPCPASLSSCPCLMHRPSILMVTKAHHPGSSLCTHILSDSNFPCHSPTTSYSAAGPHLPRNPAPR